MLFRTAYLVGKVKIFRQRPYVKLGGDLVDALNVNMFTRGLLLKNVEEAQKFAKELGLVPNHSTLSPTHPHPKFQLILMSKK